MRPKIERYFLESFFLERNSWSSITARELCSHQCLWSVFIFPELEHLYKNELEHLYKSQQLSIHIKTFLDDLKSSKDYCPRNLFSGSNSSPEKSLQKNRSIFCLENQSCDRRNAGGRINFLRRKSSNLFGELFSERNS